jgi:hypothetical protein
MSSKPERKAPADRRAHGRAADARRGGQGRAHAHLDVLVDGKPIAVPGTIGIDQRAQQISPLHTHDTNGVSHIESPVKATFSLGQFMTEWNVALAQDSIGGLKAGGGNDFHAYVNGKEYAGNPPRSRPGRMTRSRSRTGRQARGAGVPSGYDWPEGE